MRPSFVPGWCGGRRLQQRRHQGPHDNQPPQAVGGAGIHKDGCWLPLYMCQGCKLRFLLGLQRRLAPGCTLAAAVRLGAASRHTGKAAGGSRLCRAGATAAAAPAAAAAAAGALLRALCGCRAAGGPCGMDGRGAHRTCGEAMARQRVSTGCRLAVEARWKRRPVLHDSEGDRGQVQQPQPQNL